MAYTVFLSNDVGSLKFVIEIYFEFLGDLSLGVGVSVPKLFTVAFGLGIGESHLGLCFEFIARSDT